MGTKSFTFKGPDDQCAWQPHGVDTWYLGPAMNHYRLMRLRDPATGGNTDADTFCFYPAHCRTTTISEGDCNAMAAADLVVSKKKKQNQFRKTICTTAARTKGEQHTLYIRQSNRSGHPTENKTHPSARHPRQQTTSTNFGRASPKTPTYKSQTTNDGGR